MIATQGSWLELFAALSKEGGLFRGVEAKLAQTVLTTALTFMGTEELEKVLARRDWSVTAIFHIYLSTIFHISVSTAH